MDDGYIGSNVSVITKNGVKYVGCIRSYDNSREMFELDNCICHGTEDRTCEKYVAPSEAVSKTPFLVSYGNVSDLYVFSQIKSDNVGIPPSIPPNDINLTSISNFINNLDKLSLNKNNMENPQNSDDYMSNSLDNTRYKSNNNSDFLNKSTNGTISINQNYKEDITHNNSFIRNTTNSGKINSNNSIYTTSNRTITTNFNNNPSNFTTNTYTANRNSIRNSNNNNMNNNIIINGLDNSDGNLSVGDNNTSNTKNTNKMSNNGTSDINRVVFSKLNTNSLHNSSTNISSSIPKINDNTSLRSSNNISRPSTPSGSCNPKNITPINKDQYRNANLNVNPFVSVNRDSRIKDMHYFDQKFSQGNSNANNGPPSLQSTTNSYNDNSSDNRLQGRGSHRSGPVSSYNVDNVSNRKFNGAFSNSNFNSGQGRRNLWKLYDTFRISDSKDLDQERPDLDDYMLAYSKDDFFDNLVEPRYRKNTFFNNQSNSYNSNNNRFFNNNYRNNSKQRSQFNPNNKRGSEFNQFGSANKGYVNRQDHRFGQDRNSFQIDRKSNDFYKIFKNFGGNNDRLNSNNHLNKYTDHDHKFLHNYLQKPHDSDHNYGRNNTSQQPDSFLIENSHKREMQNFVTGSFKNNDFSDTSTHDHNGNIIDTITNMRSNNNNKSQSGYSFKYKNNNQRNSTNNNSNFFNRNNSKNNHNNNWNYDNNNFNNNRNSNSNIYNRNFNYNYNNDFDSDFNYNNNNYNYYDDNDYTNKNSEEDNNIGHTNNNGEWSHSYFDMKTYRSNSIGRSNPWRSGNDKQYKGYNPDYTNDGSQYDGGNGRDNYNKWNRY